MPTPRRKAAPEKPDKFRLLPIPVTSATPWLPVSPSKADAAAIQAVARGDATGDQQQRALSYIVEILADRNGMSFRSGPDGARETDFAEGRRFVGNQIVRLTKLPLSKIKEEPNG